MKKTLLTTALAAALSFSGLAAAEPAEQGIGAAAQNAPEHHLHNGWAHNLQRTPRPQKQPHSRSLVAFKIMPKIDGRFEVDHMNLIVAAARLIASASLCLMRVLSMLFFNYIANL